MCCGQNRTAVTQSQAARQASEQPLANQTLPSGISAVNPAADQSAGTYFEYRGKTGLIAIGPATGTRYHFSSPGKRLAVDPRDRPGLAMIGLLAQIR